MKVQMEAATKVEAEDRYRYALHAQPRGTCARGEAGKAIPRVKFWEFAGLLVCVLLLCRAL